MVRLALAEWGPQLAGQRVLLRSDNSAVVGILRKESSPSEQLRACYLRILQLLRLHRIDLRACHIPGRANGLADRLSRWQPRRNSEDWRFSPQLFAQLDRFVGGHSVDAFAVGANALAQHFWSPVDDTLGKNWAGLTVWANPPFSMLLRVLRHFKTAYSAMPSSTAATFVIPLWGRLGRCWPLLRGARVLGWFPQGSTIFDRPDWDRLDSAAPHSAHHYRVTQSPTPWDAVVIHFPPARFRAAGRMETAGAPLGSHLPGAGAMASLPRLSGSPAADCSALRALPPGLLPAVCARGGAAAGPLPALPALHPAADAAAAAAGPRSAGAAGPAAAGGDGAAGGPGRPAGSGVPPDLSYRGCAATCASARPPACPACPRRR